MSNKLLLISILAVVVAIGAFMIHEENESPAEKAGEVVEQFSDDAGDAARDAGDAIEDAAEDATR